MKRHLNKKVIRSELTLLHVILIITSNLFIGAGAALLFSTVLVPYSFPLIIVGIFVLMPFLYFLIKAEAKEEKVLTNLGKK